MSDIHIHLRDLGTSLVDAWQREFAGVPTVTASCGDIFSSKPGPLAADAPIDIKADAIVSPANSFGFMDGGIDAVYTYQFGRGLQEHLRALIAKEHGGELPVGMAVIVPTGHPDIPWCISAPTMRTPCDVADTVNAYLAFRAALRAVLKHNEVHTAHDGRARSTVQRPMIQSILCPGLGTAVGRMPVGRCARQMRAAWDQVFGERAIPASLRAAAQDEDALLQ